MIKYFVLKRKGLQEQVESSVATSFHMAYNNKKSMGHIAHLSNSAFFLLAWSDFKKNLVTIVEVIKL